MVTSSESEMEKILNDPSSNTSKMENSLCKNDVDETTSGMLGSDASRPKMKKKKRYHRKQKLLRPNSPAAYPSALPIRDEYFSKRPKTPTSSISNKENIKKATNKQKQTSGIPSSESENETAQLGKEDKKASAIAFTLFRVHYLIIHIAIMLADGLQGM